LGDPARLVARIEAGQVSGNHAMTAKNQNMKNFSQKIEQRKASKDERK
jgi:hypothetical protein